MEKFVFHSEPSLGRRMENFVLSLMPLFGICIFVCAVYSYTGDFTEGFTDST